MRWGYPHLNGSSLLGHIQRWASLIAQVLLTLIKSIRKIKDHTISYSKVQREQEIKVFQRGDETQELWVPGRMCLHKAPAMYWSGEVIGQVPESLSHTTVKPIALTFSFCIKAKGSLLRLFPGTTTATSPSVSQRRSYTTLHFSGFIKITQQ